MSNKGILYSFVLWAGLLFHSQAIACYFSDGGQLGTLNINMGDVTIKNDTDTPVGGIISTKDGLMSSMGGLPAKFSCGSHGDVDLIQSITITADGTHTSNAVYATNIPGVGIKFYYYSTQPYQNEPQTPTQIFAGFNSEIAAGGQDPYQNPDASLKIELIKTAPISSVGSGLLNFNANNFMMADTLNLLNVNLTANITASSCSVNTASTPTSVDLGTVYSSNLPSIGSTSNDRNFSIFLKCNANVDVNLTMSGDEDDDALGNGVLKLQPVSDGGITAAGVGIQLLYDTNKILPLNTVVNIGNAQSGSFDIPLIARYYKTQDKLTTGEVSAIATYTLTYK